MHEDLKQLLREEGNFGPSDSILEEFLGRMEEVRIKPRHRLIEYGSVNSDIYCVKEGIIRLFHMEEHREITFGFATPGTVFLSPHSYYMLKPAFLMAETCKSAATVLRMSKSTFDTMIDSFPEFAKWMFNLSMGQLYSCERKLSLINGTAKDRYLSVLKNRPEIIEAVPGNILASYLGVTPQYLCHLKSVLLGK
ncbi:MAG TPA: Crp/Fnr family transcriptional regulator [Candidatus Coprenecus pullistercoris]|nr:Crp/Fnr family transcriptional regulator [Candidatus Coprenecus pullistercoris]